MEAKGLMEAEDDPLRAELVLLLAMAPQDERAITRALGDAGIASQPSNLGRLPGEIRAGVGAIMMAQEAMSAGVLRTLAPLIEAQPIWDDMPLIILRAPRSDISQDWRLIETMTSIRNATFLERPMRIETLIQAVRVALRGRKKQYALRDQMRERDALLALSEANERRLSDVLNNTKMSVFFMDEHHHCTFMNAAAEDLTGYTLAEVEGRPLHDSVHHSHPDGRP
jgi:PAS domain-containing protein